MIAEEVTDTGTETEATAIETEATATETEAMATETVDMDETTAIEGMDGMIETAGMGATTGTEDMAATIGTEDTEADIPARPTMTTSGEELSLKFRDETREMKLDERRPGSGQNCSYPRELLMNLKVQNRRHQALPYSAPRSLSTPQRRRERLNRNYRSYQSTSIEGREGTTENTLKKRV